jgi:hypothetical protein
MFERLTELRTAMRYASDPSEYSKWMKGQVGNLSLSCVFIPSNRWLDRNAILGSIEELGRLEEGWNGYGADRIEPRMMKTAKAFVTSLAVSTPQPQVVPMTRGRLQLEWHRGNRSLELEFESPTSIRYLKFDPDRGVEEEESISADDTRQLKELLHWFTAE